MLKVGFIGAGIVGTALAQLLSSKGYRVVAVSSRNTNSAAKLSGAIEGCRVFDTSQEVADAAELVFITIPDDAIAPVVAQVKWQRGQSVVHCSGVESTEALESARKQGARVGVAHPLQTFASTNQAMENIPGSTFSLEAEEPLLGTLKKMVTAIGCDWIEIKADDKVSYHAAAAIVSNYTITLAKLATDLWQTFSVPPQQTIKAMLPLMRGTLDSIESVGIPRCLTGPIARGDAGTVKKHMDTLQKITPTMLSTYKELGLQTIPIALAKGRINEHQAQELRTLLES
ncbi:Rossmann-like and DUF2520 domain-containing protein [Chloroflexota bacterium]